MKLSYREKVGLLIVIVLAVIIVFVAWPIKTIRGNIKQHTDERTRIQEEYDKTQREIAQIPGIEANISSVYEDTKGLSDKFAPHMENLEVVKYFENLLNKEPYTKGGKTTLEVRDKLTIEYCSADELPFYYYEPNVITYPILAAADTNGDLMKTQDSVLYGKVENALQMSTYEPQQVEMRTVTIPMKFTKESLLALEDELKKNETGIIISGVKVEDYTFNYVTEVPEDKGFSNGEVVFKFYTMQQIQKPDFSK